MVLFPSVFGGLRRTESIKKGMNCRDIGRETAAAFAKEAEKKESSNKNNFSVCSKRGTKGINQDSFIIWEEYGCQEDMVLCGMFDGHGTWGHLVSKHVKKSMPASLFCNWQEMVAHGNLVPFDIWKQSYLKTYQLIDHELKHHPRIDSFFSGTTALTIVKQGQHLYIANVGDSRAVLATTNSKYATLKPLQLTIDNKPNLPQEAERIKESKGRIFCLDDEPGVYRVWKPNAKSPGLALSRALGDFCVKDYGLISVPDITQRTITSNDQFLILATDGVWDVISNEEAVQIVGSTPNREQSAKRLVESASLAWKRKRRGVARDDISAICLFFHSSSS